MMLEKVQLSGWLSRLLEGLGKFPRYVSNQPRFEVVADTLLQASSLEQTHALVTFGYLSMLICTLCLDDEIRNAVRGSMKSRSLHPLTIAVEEFLNHFRIVEQVTAEDEASSNFTERFGGVLNKLKMAEGIS